MNGHLGHAASASLRREEGHVFWDSLVVAGKNQNRVIRLPVTRSPVREEMLLGSSSVSAARERGAG
jgi:hypothetical protein